MQFFSHSSLLDATAEALLREAPDYDLGALLIVVPTAEAGRRLVETLALRAADAGRALFAPRVITPRQLPGLVGAESVQPPASPAGCMAAWNVLLDAVDSRELKALFPLSTQSGKAWRLGVASLFYDLQQQLAEGAWSFAQVAAECDGIPAVERRRWLALAGLEARFSRLLEDLGWCDPFAAERAVVEQLPLPPEPIERIILCAVPSPLPLVVRYLQGLRERGYPIDVWVATSEEDKATFDDWGRPLTKHWESCELPAIANLQLQVVTRAPLSLTETVREVLQAKSEGVAAIGVADPALLPDVADACRRLGRRPNDPSGQPLSACALGRTLIAILECAEEADVARVRVLLQSSLIWPTLLKRAGLSADDCSLRQQDALRVIDKIADRHLPQTLEEVLAFARQSKRPEMTLFAAICQQLAADLKRLRVGQSRRVQWLGDWLAECIEAQSSADVTREEVEVMRRVLEELDGVEACWAAYGKVSTAFADGLLAILSERLRATQVYIPDPEADVDLLGWLELPWAECRYLLVCGLNEGVVPQTVRGDLFLPESLRVRLGLTTNNQRYASDSFLFSMLSRRAANGNGGITLYLPKTAADGSPLRPSRLLFRCDDASLLQRTRVLFGASEQAAPAESPPLVKGGLSCLRAPAGLVLPQSLSFSALGAYLRCPFRFFLTHILKMREPRSEASDMNAAVFGSLLHAVCSHLQGHSYDQLSDEKRTLDYLQTALDREMRIQFGTTTAFSLAVQRSLLESRLEMLARILAERAQTLGAGTILITETDVSFAIGGFELRGRIDRIDCLGQAGRVLLDYKTARSGNSPLDAHWTKLPRAGLPAHVPESALCVLNGEEGYWTDLQLPLYALAMEAEHGFPLEAAYCNLPDSAEKADWVAWPDWSREVAVQALQCAADVLERIQSGHFWPPSNKIPAEWDPFAELFPEGIESGFDAASVAPYCFAPRRDTASQSITPARNTQIE